MKLLLALSIIALTGTATTCKSKKNPSAETGYRGRLEIKAGCMNYTIALVSGGLDSSLVVPSWTDETSGKTYRNVFALGSPCTFPESIKEGDEFTFTIDSTTKQDCAVCMMYYPTPPKRLRIKVIQETKNKQ